MQNLWTTRKFGRMDKIKEKINTANSATVLNQSQLAKGDSGSGRLTMTQGPLPPKALNSGEEND